MPPLLLPAIVQTTNVLNVFSSAILSVLIISINFISENLHWIRNNISTKNIIGIVRIRQKKIN